MSYLLPCLWPDGAWRQTSYQCCLAAVAMVSTLCLLPWTPFCCRFTEPPGVHSHSLLPPLRWVWTTDIQSNLLKFHFFKLFITKLFKKRLYLFSFREMGREGNKHGCLRDTSTDRLSHAPNQGPGSQPRHGPDQELNLQPFDSQVGVQSTEPHQPGPNS